MMKIRKTLFASNNLRLVAEMSTMEKLFNPVNAKTDFITSKVTVVGCGQVGMAAAFSVLAQGISGDVVLVDMLEGKVQGESMDLQHGSCFLNNARITGGSDYALTAGSKVCLITAGVRQREGESRLDLVNRNVEILKTIVPQLVKYSPDATILVASNPVDILTYVTWKLSGLPHHRVIGSGTNLDSARFRYLLSEKLQIASTYVHGYIIGEHGDSSVPIWSSVNIAGVRLSELSPAVGSVKDKENWKDMHKAVVDSAYDVIKLKGYTSWAIGLSLAQLINAMLTNAKSVHPVSTLMKGHHGIEKEVFLSLPCVLAHNGITDVIRQTLSKDELEQLRNAADMMAKIQSGIQF